MFTATLNLSEESINQLVSHITNRVISNMSDTMHTIADILAEQVTKDSIQDLVKKEVAKVVTTENSNQKETSSEPTTQFDAMAIQLYCEDVIKKILSGDTTAADNATAEISRLSNGLVTSRLGMIRGTKHGFNFGQTAQLRKIMPAKWNGFIKTENIAARLTEAFGGYQETAQKENDVTRDSETEAPLHKKRQRGLSHTQGSYTRVKSGSRLFKMRFDKDGNAMPMIVDRALAEELMGNNYTHVTLTKSENGKEMFMVFTESDKKTIAPKNSPIISRLNVYGLNHKNGEPTTFSIASRNFQKTILNHFHLKGAPGKELFLSFTDGAEGVHDSNGRIFSRFKGKKYRSVRLGVAQ